MNLSSEPGVSIFPKPFCLQNYFRFPFVFSLLFCGLVLELQLQSVIVASCLGDGDGDGEETYPYVNAILHFCLLPVTLIMCGPHCYLLVAVSCGNLIT